tara:strand:+ start:1084 stop:1902 length:819 start_codon:yes stop_codon:yes gene_type:complete
MIKSKNEKVILAQPWGGLGDNLQFSNLPELYNKQGKYFYLSYFNRTRNKEIHNFCWEQNEFYSGKILSKPNIGWKIWVDSLEKNNHRKDINIIQKQNLSHGFEEGEGYPLFTVDNKLQMNKIEHKYLADFNAITSIPSETGWNQIHEYVNKTDLTILSFPGVQNLTNAPNLIQQNKQKLDVTSINNLLETLSKTDTFICLNSGSQTLAAGLKNIIGRPNNIISFVPGAKDVSSPDGRFMFANVEYKILDGLPGKVFRDFKQEIYEKLYLKYF